MKLLDIKSSYVSVSKYYGKHNNKLAKLFVNNSYIHLNSNQKMYSIKLCFFYCNSMRTFEYIMFIMSGASSKLELMCKTRIIWSIYLYDVSFSIVLAGSLGNKSKRF